MADEMSKLSDKFHRIWQDVDGPPLWTEYRFCHRKFRLDFAYVPSLYAVEIHGGVWVGGRHTSGAGFTKDCEKTRWAGYCGWTIFPMSTSDINHKSIKELADFFRGHTRRQIWWKEGERKKQEETQGGITNNRGK